MSFSLDEIRVLRRRLNLTQNELAKVSGVSQSLIAKIELRKIDPSYSSVQKIHSTLDSFANKKQKKIEELIRKPVIYISAESELKAAVDKLKRFGISQMPVMREGTVLGMVSESIILDAIVQNKPHHLVRDIMEEPPPIISTKTSIDLVKSLLLHFSLVLVAEKGRIVGVITKADLLGGI